MDRPRPGGPEEEVRSTPAMSAAGDGSVPETSCSEPCKEPLKHSPLRLLYGMTLWGTLCPLNVSTAFVFLVQTRDARDSKQLPVDRGAHTQWALSGLC